MPENYSGAGHGQCLAVTNARDEHRCRNGVYGAVACCGTHLRSDSVTFAPEIEHDTSVEWYCCGDCGWQRAFRRRDDGPQRCEHCGEPFDADAIEWHAHESTPDRVAADGGVTDA